MHSVMSVNQSTGVPSYDAMGSYHMMLWYPTRKDQSRRTGRKEDPTPWPQISKPAQPWPLVAVGTRWNESTRLCCSNMEQVWWYYIGKYHINGQEMKDPITIKQPGSLKWLLTGGERKINTLLIFFPAKITSPCEMRLQLHNLPPPGTLFSAENFPCKLSRTTQYK